MVLRRLFGGKKEEATETNSNTENSSVETAETPTSAPTPQNLSGTVNPNEPQPALQLEEAIIENGARDTPDSRNKLYQELLFSDMLLALADPQGSEAAQQPDPNQLSVAILTNPQGTRFAAAFTSGPAARRWRPEGGQFVSIRGQDIYKLLEPSPAEVLVINAGSEQFVVLPKIDCRQLALGVVPQNSPSPVHTGQPQQQAAGATATDTGAGEANQGQMQVAFPPDVFSDVQKAHAKSIMEKDSKIEAAVLGAILPPNAKQEDGWIRTVFLRVKDIEPNNEAMQSFCVQVRQEIIANQQIFADFGFEVGVMPDPGFWAHMHQNGIILFDKNPAAVAAAQQTQQPTQR